MTAPIPDTAASVGRQRGDGIPDMPAGPVLFTPISRIADDVDDADGGRPQYTGLLHATAWFVTPGTPTVRHIPVTRETAMLAADEANAGRGRQGYTIAWYADRDSGIIAYDHRRRHQPGALNSPALCGVKVVVGRRGRPAGIAAPSTGRAGWTVIRTDHLAPRAQRRRPCPTRRSVRRGRLTPPPSRCPPGSSGGGTSGPTGLTQAPPNSRRPHRLAGRPSRCRPRLRPTFGRRFGS